MELHEDLNLGVTPKEDKGEDYRSLLDNFPLRPTLYIGLGGSGCAAVGKIKRLFQVLYTPKADQATEGVERSIPACYEFLGFDTNISDRPPGMAENRDWFHLGVNDLNDFYQNQGQNQFFREWIIKGFPEGAIMSGASGLRNLGRLCLTSNFTVVRDAIQAKTRLVLKELPGLVNSKPVVYLFCSLSGGTGSGMIIDTCFLLRQLIPGVDMIGIIAVVDGLPEMDEESKQMVKVNTYCGLKELNAFMSENIEGVEFGKTATYPLGVNVKITAPLNECYLLSSSKASGTISLPSHNHVSSFMARLVFMMSAYSFKPVEENNSPDYAGVFNNHREHLARRAMGVRTCYVVPGMGQVHFPIIKTANLMAVKTAIRYLEFQSGGKAGEGDKEARAFAAKNSLNFSGVRESVSRDPRLQGNHPLTAFRYDEVVAEALEKGDRYENAEQILSFGRKIPHGRYNELEALLRKNVNPSLEGLSRALRQDCHGYLANPEYLAIGMMDFLKDLQALIDEEIALLEKDCSRSIKEYGALEERWREIEREVIDVVTRQSAFDAVKDRFKLARTKTLYIMFLNEAEAIIVSKVRNDLARTLLTQIRDEARSLHDRATAVFATAAASAVTILQSRRLQLAVELHNQEQGQADDVENVCSFNVMTQDWRRSYMAKTKVLGPENVLNSLLANWHPAKLLELKPPEGVEFSRFLAQEILSRVAGLLEKERNMTPLEVLQSGDEFKGKTTEEMIAYLYYKLLSPQMQLNAMKSRLGVIPHSVVFCGGIDNSLEERFKNRPELIGAPLSVSDNLEKNRINFFTSVCSVAMAGCDNIINVFETAYNTWHEQINRLEKKEQEYELAKFHCYPGSHKWRRPTYFLKEIETNLALFARAMAVSVMLDVNEPDLAILSGFGATPKDKRYSIFQVGSSQFWLTPFFEPCEAGSKGATVKGKMIKLGSNIAGAYKTICSDETLIGHAREWVNWFGTNWSRFYNAPSLQEKKKQALRDMYDRKGKTDDPAHIELWDQLIEALSNWEDLGN